MSCPACATGLPPRSAMHRDTPHGSRLDIANAYALGDLQTREEFIASINFGAASDMVHEVVGLGRGIVVTAAGIEAIISAALGDDRRLATEKAEEATSNSDRDYAGKQTEAYAQPVRGMRLEETEHHMTESEDTP